MSYYRYEQYDIFQQVFQAPLHRDHELMVLGEHIDWDGITDRLLGYDSRRGRQAKRIRLMVGNLVGAHGAIFERGRQIEVHPGEHRKRRIHRSGNSSNRVLFRA